MADHGMEFVEADSWVWFRHPQEKWLPCHVETGGTQAELVDEEGNKFSCAANECYPMHESSLTAVGNMVELGDLNEAAILHNLRLRYKQGDTYPGIRGATRCDVQIFTYIGPILVSCNPYKSLPIFNKDFIKLYYDRVTCSAYEQMLSGKKNQSMVISGESGAGKTEATKICLSFLAQVAGSQGAASPSQLLLDSSPIMESFGNAKTVRNNNSSRFGKYMDLYFGSDKKIVNGNIKKYLLEKSRIVYQAPGERNYHVFFQVFHLPAAWQAQMKLTAPEDYFYLKQGGEGCSTVDGIDDAHELQLMRDAFERLQISDEDAIKMFSIVAAVMHLGNTQFEQSGDDTVQVSNTDAVAVASSLLGVNADKCTQTLVTREIKAGREIAIANNNKKQAQDSRDGLAKALYGKLFDHLTAMINEGIDGVKTGEKVNSIGVLDIFGFEIFKVNSFEQLCINLANEKLQFHFNAHIFVLELEIYKGENLDVEAITFKDNQGCLDLIEAKKTGILAMIEEEIYVPRGSDDTLLEKLHGQHVSKSDFYKRPKMTGGGRGKDKERLPTNCFVVVHFAGEVSYSVTSFLEKCKDRLPPDAEAMVKASEKPLVQKLFAEEPTEQLTPRRGGRVPTLGGQFKESLGQLYNTLMATQPHFIKCVKPNSVKQCHFDSNFTLYQLTYLGLLEVIRIRKSGYPVRMLDKEFKGKYKLLMPEVDAGQLSSRAICEAHGMDGEWQIGTTMVFMRDMMYKSMESKRAQAMHQNVRMLQAWVREELVRVAWLKTKKGYVAMQAAYRAGLGREIAARRKLEADLEKQCRTALQLRKEELCVAALARADEIDYHPPKLDEVRYIIDRIRDEREVEGMLRSAIHRKDLDDVEEALRAVDAIELTKAWSSLPKSDERAALIPRCQLVYDQLTKYGDLLKMLADAMAARTIDRLHAAIQEAERLQVGTPDNPSPEVDEARAMIKMAEFERTSKQEREARKAAAAQSSASDEPAEGTPPSMELLHARRTLQVAAVSPMLRAAVTAASADKLSTAIAQASSRLDAEAAAESRELALAKEMLQQINSASGDSASITRRLDVAMDTVASGSIDDKQRDLGIAIALAAKTGTAVSEEATQAWREISEASMIQSMLVQANSSGRHRLLDIAVLRAQQSSAFATQAGSAGQELLRVAVEKHQALQKEQQAKRELEDAGGSIEPTAEALPDAARRRKYRITRLPRLRNRMLPLYCSTEALENSLLMLPEGQGDDRAFSEAATSVSRNLVSFMWPSESSEDTQTLLASLLDTGANQPQLRDEMYTQLIRQGTRNDDSVSMLRWCKLLLLVVQSFSASATLHPFVIVWLEEELSSATGQAHNANVKAALQQALQLLQTTSVPTQTSATMPTVAMLSTVSSELEQAATDVAVYLLGGSSSHFSNTTTIRAVVDTLVDTLQLTGGGSKYGLYQVPAGTAMTTEARLLTSKSEAAEMTLGAVMAGWAAPAAAGSLAAKLVPRTKASYRFCFMRRLFFTDMVQSSTKGDIDMLYMHARKRISEGVFVCDEEDVQTLAGLAVQAELGDYDDVATPPTLKAKLGDYIPNQAKRLQTPKEWLADVSTTHQRMAGFSSLSCKKNYVRLMCKYSQFGHTLFTVRLASVNHGEEADAGEADLPIGVMGRLSVLGVNSQGVTVFEPSTKQIRESVTYNDIGEWKHERTHVLVSLPDSGRSLSIQAVPMACAELVSLLADYSAVFPKRRKEKRQLRTAKN